MTCQLYRHFDAAGDLLYVGISLSAVGRLAQHRSSADWFDQIAKIEIEQFETRDLALAAEAAAINAERPKYNRVIPFTTGKPRQILSLDEQRQLIAELRASFPDHLAVQLALADYEVLAIEANPELLKDTVECPACAERRRKKAAAQKRWRKGQQS